MLLWKPSFKFLEELHFFKLWPPIAGIGTKEWPCYDTWAFWLSLALLGWGTVWHFVAMYRVVWNCLVLDVTAWYYEAM